MDFDAIVVGGGHAGIEAALALARLNFKTLMITQNLDCIGKMSCNPAIGGLAKGNVVREIDALGGQMGQLIDATMIQFRILNRSKGPAVQAPRAQADMYEYSLMARWVLEKEKNLTLFQDTVTDLILDTPGRQIEGVITARRNRFRARTVVITTGTFMEGKIFIGQYIAPGGRIGEPAAEGLGLALREKGFDLGRMKTGTPARVHRGSLNFEKMTEQPGDEVMLPFSFGNKVIKRPTVSCHITYTNENTHKIIRENMHLSPLYTGKIVGLGPRYCPSIEDKVKRFPERERHQIFVEPEGLRTEEMYLNGISSSLPEEVQEKFLRTVPGLENLVIMKPGYAVEYDYLNPTQLYPTLESKRVRNLYFAGQTNGTSGYEEAGAQGLMAGINAALRMMKREEPFLLSRAEAYIGVLIDDLVTLGTNEPYRLFTSRAEYRLNLRHDTADFRLTEKGYEIGLVSRERMEFFQEKRIAVDSIKELLKERRITSELLASHREYEPFGGKSLEQVLKNPEIHMSRIQELLSELKEQEEEHLYQAELDIKYEGYIKRQEIQVNKFRKMENMKIPRGFDYDGLLGLSAEGKEKLKKIDPLSVGQAQRIMGVRPSDISILLLHLKK